MTVPTDPRMKKHWSERGIWELMKAADPRLRDELMQGWRDRDALRAQLQAAEADLATWKAAREAAVDESWRRTSELAVAQASLQRVWDWLVTNDGVIGLKAKAELRAALGDAGLPNQPEPAETNCGICGGPLAACSPVGAVGVVPEDTENQR